MAGIEKIYLGSKLIDKVYLGENLVSIGLGEQASSSGVLYTNLPEISNPIDSITPTPSASVSSVSKGQLDVMKTLGVLAVDQLSLLELGIEIPCEGGFPPTRADIVKEFNKLNSIPTQLKQNIIDLKNQFVGEVDAEAQEIIGQLEDIIIKVETTIDEVSTILAPYWDKEGKIRNWEKEADDAFNELIQEYQLFIPVKIVEMISKLIPVDFNLNIMGIEIDLLKIFTEEEQASIKLQIEERLDELYLLIPEPFRSWDGTYGVKCREWKAKITWQYIKSELMNAVTNLLWDLFNKLIEKFKEIWDALGLPSIPDLLNFDINEWVDSIITEIEAEVREKIAEVNQKIERVEGFFEGMSESDLELEKQKLAGKGYALVADELKKVEILGFNVYDDIIGGDMEGKVKSAEQDIDNFKKGARDFALNWQMHLLGIWIKKIKKFLDKIGLGKLLDILTLDFCEVLGLLGIPTKIEIAAP